MHIVKYYLYSTYYTLDLYGLFSAQYKFVPFNTTNIIPKSPSPGNHWFTLCVFVFLHVW